METTLEQLKSLANKGFKERYGEHPDKLTLLRLLCEYRRIDVMGFTGIYLIAYRIFKEAATSMGINVWPRGGMTSSMVCYCLGLTEVDPVRYGLHSARFVNEEPPKFQFDVEDARFDEFNAKADEVLKDNSDILDYETGCKYLLGDLQPSRYLSRKRENPLLIPDDLDDEIVEYALSFPDTMYMYETYMERTLRANWTPTGIVKLDEVLAPTNGLLAYQEQMLDIMKSCFNVHGSLANKMRLAIQRGEVKNIDTYRKELLETAKSKGLSNDEYETVWAVLTSNPKAFLKAHAVSRVVSKYLYEEDQIIPTGKLNGYEYVDLGLSVMWATCNLGASKPEDYGNYYAWGENEPKSNFRADNYKFRICGKLRGIQLSKYNTQSENGTVDNKTTLDPVDDAALTNYGGSWRIPTAVEMDELCQNCSWKCIKFNGVRGYRFTSKIKGYTDRSIFLPAASHISVLDIFADNFYGYYWTSALDTRHPGSAVILLLCWTFDVIIPFHRYAGCSVRPVFPKDYRTAHTQKK